MKEQDRYIYISEITSKILMNAFAKGVRSEKIHSWFYPGAAQNLSLNIFPYEKR